MRLRQSSSRGSADPTFGVGNPRQGNCRTCSFKQQSDTSVRVSSVSNFDKNKPSLNSLFESKKLDLPKTQFWDQFQNEVKGKVVASASRPNLSQRFAKISTIIVPVFLLRIYHFQHGNTNAEVDELPLLAHCDFRRIGVVASSKVTFGVNDEYQRENGKRRSASRKVDAVMAS